MLTAIGNFCIVSIAIGIVIEIIVMYPIQHRQYRAGINNLLVLLIGGIPIAMPTVLSVTMAIGSHRLSKQVSNRELETLLDRSYSIVCKFSLFRLTTQFSNLLYNNRGKMLHNPWFISMFCVVQQMALKLYPLEFPFLCYIV